MHFCPSCVLVTSAGCIKLGFFCLIFFSKKNHYEEITAIKTASESSSNRVVMIYYLSIRNNRLNLNAGGTVVKTHESFSSTLFHFPVSAYFDNPNVALFKEGLCAGTRNVLSLLY